MEPIIVEMGGVISVLCNILLKALSKRLRLIGQRGNLRALGGICEILLKLFLEVVIQRKPNSCDVRIFQSII